MLRRVVTPDGPFTEQTIATAGLGLQQTPIRTERLANRCCVNLKRVFHDYRAGPDAMHQLVLCDELAGRSGENFDYLEGPPTNRHWRSENPKFAAGKVNLALARRVDQSIAGSGHHNDPS